MSLLLTSQDLVSLQLVKRFIAILLILLFAANISEATVTHHLCGKIFQYISLTGHKKNTKCCCKGGKMDKGCCKTTHLKVKIEDKKITSHSSSLEKPFTIEALVLQSGYLIPETIRLSAEPNSEEDYVPQKVRWRRDRLYVFHCVYRI